MANFKITASFVIMVAFWLFWLADKILPPFKVTVVNFILTIVTVFNPPCPAGTKDGFLTEIVRVVGFYVNFPTVIPDSIIQEVEI